MLLLARHAATGKNLVGGTDNPLTPIVKAGRLQARAMGADLHAYLAAHGIRTLDVITSGYERTNATAREALREIERLSAINGISIAVASFVEDDRLGEIKFKPATFPADADHPGFFGRQLEGTTRAAVLQRLQAFHDDRLAAPRPVHHAVLMVGHRASNQVFVQEILRAEMELWKKNNCEIWRIDRHPLEIVHHGVKADRDADDPRRAAFLERRSSLRDGANDRRRGSNR